MLLVAACKKPKSIPSAVHVDNTARVQTINKFQNQKVYQIVKHFKKITGTPIILNTSFNDAGEPMVETPLDALICTIQTGIDYLIIDNFLINKNDLNKKIYKNLINFRKKKLNAREKFIFKKLFNKISVKEFLKKKNIENKSAIFRSIYSSKETILKFFKKNLYKKVLIIGTSDHTSIIEKALLFSQNPTLYNH